MPTKPQPQVVALTSFVGAIKGKDVRVLRGDTFAATDPIVRNWPDLFSKPDGGPVIEQATAAPGEKRGA